MFKINNILEPQLDYYYNQPVDIENYNVLAIHLPVPNEIKLQFLINFQKLFVFVVTIINLPQIQDIHLKQLVLHYI